MGRGAVSAVLCAGVLAGCYGSTEPATEVAFDRAKLNGRGTADKGPAYSYFEYAPTATGFPGARTAIHSWPANASGPLSERAFPLYAGTSYSYRLCGNDQGKEPAACAQTRTFTTPAATRDAVRGSWREGGTSPHARLGGADATASATPGGSPTGTVGLAKYYEGTLIYTGRVTCLQVSDRRAVVSSIGEATFDGSAPDPNTSTPNSRARVTINDGGPGGTDRTVVEFIPGGGTPPACVASTSPGTASDGFDVNVYDAP